MRYGKLLNGEPAKLSLKRANRHGLIAGATGTGKTVTLQTFAERFSREGVPVFCVDVKGDLEGIASDNNVVFWDVFGEYGHRIRTSVRSMGAVLLSRMMELTQVQSGVVSIAFRYAKDADMPLQTIEDFKHVLRTMVTNREELSLQYGNVTAGSVSAILRSLLTFEEQGGAEFFGFPELDIFDFLNVDDAQRGQINLLNAVKLVNSPKLYSTFLLWLLSEFYSKLPEVGDPEKPKFVFFFDEAHLLFSEGSKTMIELVERTVRLIRSKGVGVYFVTQAPADVPDAVLAQLSNRVQHALRAFTPKALRGVNAAAATMPINPAFDAAETLKRLSVGQALSSMLMRNGTPSMVDVVQVDLPDSQLGPLHPEERKEMVAASPFAYKYGNHWDAVERITPYSTKGRNDTLAAIFSWIVVAGMLSPVWMFLYLIYTITRS